MRSHMSGQCKTTEGVSEERIEADPKRYSILHLVKKDHPIICSRGLTCIPDKLCSGQVV